MTTTIRRDRALDYAPPEEQQDQRGLVERLHDQGMTLDACARSAGGASYEFEEKSETLSICAGSGGAEWLRTLNPELPEGTDHDAWHRLVESAAFACDYEAGRGEEWRNSWPNPELARQAEAVARLSDATQAICHHPAAGVHGTRWDQNMVISEAAADDLEGVRTAGLDEQNTEDAIRWIGSRLALMAAEIAQARTGIEVGTQGNFTRRVQTAAESMQEHWTNAELNNEQRPDPQHRDRTINRLQEAMEAVTGAIEGTDWQEPYGIDPKFLNPPERALLFCQMARGKGYDEGVYSLMKGIISPDWLEQARAQDDVRDIMQCFKAGEERDEADAVVLISEIADGMSEPQDYRREMLRDYLNHAASDWRSMPTDNALSVLQGELERDTVDGPGTDRWLEASAMIRGTAEDTMLLRASPGATGSDRARTMTEMFTEAQVLEITWLEPADPESYRAMGDSVRRMLQAADEVSQNQITARIEALNAVCREEGSSEMLMIRGEVQKRLRESEERIQSEDLGIRLETHATSALALAHVEWELQRAGPRAAMQWWRRHGLDTPGEDPPEFPERIGEACQRAAERGRADSVNWEGSLDYREVDTLGPLGYVENDGGRPEDWGIAGDCVTRAMAVLSGEENYTSIWNSLTAAKLERDDPTRDADHGVSFESYNQTMMNMGITTVYSMLEPGLSPRDVLDIREINLATGGIDCITSQATHMSAVRDGKLHDTSDWAANPNRDPLMEIYARVGDADQARESIRRYFDARNR